MHSLNATCARLQDYPDNALVVSDGICGDFWIITAFKKDWLRNVPRG